MRILRMKYELGKRLRKIGSEKELNLVATILYICQQADIQNQGVLFKLSSLRKTYRFYSNYKEKDDAIKKVLDNNDDIFEEIIEEKGNIRVKLTDFACNNIDCSSNTSINPYNKLCLDDLISIKGMTAKRLFITAYMFELTKKVYFKKEEFMDMVMMPRESTMKDFKRMRSSAIKNLSEYLSGFKILINENEYNPTKGKVAIFWKGFKNDAFSKWKEKAKGIKNVVDKHGNVIELIEFDKSSIEQQEFEFGNVKETELISLGKKFYDKYCELLKDNQNSCVIDVGYLVRMKDGCLFINGIPYYDDRSL